MEKFGWAGTYLLLAAGGVAALFTGAPAATQAVGVGWTVAWGILLAFGSLIAAYGAFRDYKFEAGGMFVAGIGATMYSLSLWVISTYSPNRPIHTALIISAVAFAAFGRFLYIRHERKRFYKALEANDHLEQNGH